jgi:hypothetical protein
MIFGTVKLVYRLVTFVVVAYFFFGVPLGERTLYQHMRRIVATEEAQDLGKEIREVGAQVGDRLDDEIEVETANLAE